MKYGAASILAGLVVSCVGDTTHATSPPSSTKRYHTYTEARKAIEAHRKRLHRMYRRAQTRKARKAVIRIAGETLVDEVFNGLFPFWYGTPWDFNGTTRIPRKGRIACGYFVSTILKHAGLKVQRPLLGQQPSSYIIKTMTRRPHIKGTSGYSIKRFVSAIQKMGDGLYIVGLSYHVGFLVVRKGQVFFVHTSYGDPPVVVKEKALNSPILAASNHYRIVGRISSDSVLLVKWLYGARFLTKRWKRKRRK